MHHDVVAAAWAANPPPPPPPPPQGHCGRCGQTQPVWPAHQALSPNFSAYDTWTSPSHRWLCAACTWAYTTPALRSTTHRITTTATLQSLTRTQALDLLRSHPLTSDEALVMPLRPGRRHLLPTAPWGHITTDPGPIPWTSTDTHLLTEYAALRQRGFTPADLASRAPDFKRLQRCGGPDLAGTLNLWKRLDPWRCPDSPWLAIASHVTKEMH